MRKRLLTAASDELSRLVGVAPPVIPHVLRGGTRLTGRWTNQPYEGYVAPMNEHVIAATFEGDGFAHARIDGKQIAAPSTPGAITMAPRGHDGEWRITGPLVVTNVYLGHDRLLDCGDQVAEGRAFELLDRVNYSDTKLFTIMRLIADEIDNPEHHSLVFLEHALDILCLQLIRQHSTLGDPIRLMQRGLARWQVNRVTAYMRENMASDISLQDLANVVGMSRFHFCSAFHAATGTPPHEHLTRLRIKCACQLLNDHRLPIQAIALAVGYSTPSAFSATFHRIVGVTPRQYRKDS